MEKHIPWYSDERVSAGTYLGGLSLVILGLLNCIGVCVPLEILYPALLKIMIVSFIIHTMVDIYTSENWDRSFTIYSLQILFGGIVGASVWVFIITYVLDLIMPFIGMNLGVVESVIGLIMFIVMRILYP